jgi:hypothetical protein
MNTGSLEVTHWGVRDGGWRGSDTSAGHRHRPDNVLGGVRDADIAVALRERTRYDANVLGQMPHLKLIVSVGGH